MERSHRLNLKMVEKATGLPILHRELVPVFNRILLNQNEEIDTINNIIPTDLIAHLIDTGCFYLNILDSHFTDGIPQPSPNIDGLFDVSEYGASLLKVGFSSTVFNVYCNGKENMFDKYTMFIRHNEIIVVAFYSGFGCRVFSVHDQESLEILKKHNCFT